MALAAGHRPCAVCRRADFNAWLDSWASAFGDRPTVNVIDRRLHDERLDGTGQRGHRRPWRDLPVGAFVAIDDEPSLVLGDRLVPWSPAGYGSPIDRPARGDATVLTPAPTIAVRDQGYRPVIHPSGRAEPGSSS